MDKRYHKHIEAAFEYAASTGSFSLVNRIKQAKHVCIVGIDLTTEKIFLDKDVRKRFNLTHVCVYNKSNLEAAAKRNSEWNCLKYVVPEGLKELDNVVCLLLGKDPRWIERRLDAIGVPHICYTDLMLELLDSLSPRSDDLDLCKEKAIEACDLLDDEYSKSLFCNLLCLRIAYPLSIYSYGDMFSKGEYFSTNLFLLSNKEHYIDCGAYNGNSIRNFLESVKYQFQGITAFEIDEQNFNECNAFLKTMVPMIQKKIQCHNSGVWNENKKIFYGSSFADKEGVSIFKDHDAIQGKVVKLDDVERCFDATLIKMDIEGAERQALEGAAGIIEQQQPKLTIALYHRLSDLWEIPCYVHSLNQKYKLSIRHHGCYFVWGTCFYAY